MEPSAFGRPSGDRAVQPVGAGQGPGRRASLGPTARALRFALAYAAFASAWIYFSDRALALIVSDPEQLFQWNVYKGIAFVALTSALLFALSGRNFRAMERRSRDLHATRAQLERLNRLYSALGQLSQAVVRSSGREELFRKACQILVEQGAVQMTWIGRHDASTGQLIPEAAFGVGSDYPTQVQIYLDERPEGRGPSGIAFRESRPAICNDVARDPAMQLWRDQALAHGCRSCAAFPLRVGGVITGILCVYAAEAGYFQGPEVAVLEEAALDLSFALENFDREAERQAALEMATKERAFSNTVIESMPGILYFYNEKLQLLRWNRNFEQVSGYSGDEVAQMNPLEFFAPEDRADVAQAIAKVFESGSSTVESSFMAKDGTRTPYFFTGLHIVHEGENCLAGVGIDISEQKRARAALITLNETLEQKVEERTEELKASVIRAETSDRLKSAFLATMSHELRTPLNSIIGFTGVLQGGLAGPINEEQTKQLGMVRGSARHLLELINDVLDLSKIEAGELKMASETFDLPASLERVQASLAPAARKAGLTLASNIDSRLGTMTGDRRRIEQIALNLLNNAIKFTESGSVTLEADRVDDTAGPAVRICVADTGIGIAPEHMAILFRPFRQVDNALSREYEGTGLGLAICQRLASLMGGRIEVASTLGTGSRFTVTLPLEPGGSASP